MVYRAYVEKLPAFAEEARRLERELRGFLGIRGMTGLRIVERYDVEGPDAALFEETARTILRDAPLDALFFEEPRGDYVLAVEYLPGQFDQRARAAADCALLLGGGARPLAACARLYVFAGRLTAEERAAVERFLINPVDSRAAGLAPRAALGEPHPDPSFPPVLFGAGDAGPEAARAFIARYGLAMDGADFLAAGAAFKAEERDPTLVEMRILDAYWSDHCRHTTFETEIDAVTFAPGALPALKESYGLYRALRREAGRAGAGETLMDIATAGARALRARGLLSGWDRSEEVNACAIKVDVDIDGGAEPYLLLFKNETHNHPTEIEPFGGAATCIGGAIRDPLSGRAMAYQAMRVSGSGDPRARLTDTLPGKLPQRRLCREAARGFSSYGNQAGIATGHVREWYHEGYRAKRFEAGAVVGAVPAARVRRERPAPGDVVILAGGRTGRDGCGGAAGSSKSHTRESLEACGAEVQKGDATEERKLQRLFRDARAVSLIKRCNDFGAGGVAVAVGELAEGLEIDLDAVPKKYAGLDAVELAISESQERMAVVVAPEDAAAFIERAARENVEAAPVARVTAGRRLVMKWRGRVVADIPRALLDEGRPRKHARVAVPPGRPLAADAFHAPRGGLEEAMRALLTSLSVCSRRGLIERFDATIGAGTVLMPLGGRFQKTPEDVMAALVPVLDDEYDGGDEGAGGEARAPRRSATASGMACGFDPQLSELSPYEGAYCAVLESLARLVAAGFSRSAAYLSLQEYFPRPGSDPERWAAPFAALLGAFQAQIDFGVGAIGGKDSMSGTFEAGGARLDVPPTLVSFALAAGPAANVRGGAFGGPGRVVLRARPVAPDGALRPEAAAFRAAASFVERLLAARDGAGKPLAAACRAPSRAGCAEALFMMAAGNRVGFHAAAAFGRDALFAPALGSFIIELEDGVSRAAALRAVYGPDGPAGEDARAAVDEIGVTAAGYRFSACGESACGAALEAAWEGVLEEVYPTRPPAPEETGGRQAAAARTETAQNEATQAETRQTEAGQTEVSRAEAIQAETRQTGAARAEAARAEDDAAAPPRPRRRAARARPLAVIPVFPGTNCEYDTARAFEEAGVRTRMLVARTADAGQIAESVRRMARAIAGAQILALPGGFSGGDEPGGSAKLIAAFFRAAALRDATEALLREQDGLILGICNGFQALVKLGLLPGGTIAERTAASCALAGNVIGRHQSRLVTTRIECARSPWFLRETPGALHSLPVSHGEGRFIAPPETLDALRARGQIATVYVDETGAPSMAADANPAGSMRAIEGVTSPDGRILGKMAHSERRGGLLYRNAGPANRFQKIFESAAAYYE